MSFIHRQLGMLCIIWLSVIGCSNKIPADLPKLYPVELTITQQEKPLPNAYVQLIEVADAPKYSSGGTTDNNGTVIIKTHSKYNGVPKGNYIVTVTKEETLQKGPWDKIPEDYTEAKKFREANKKQLISDTFQLVAPKFRSRKTSDLRISVEEQGVKQTFELGAPVHEKLTI